MSEDIDVGLKDLSEKSLLKCTDVFADVANLIMFDGQPVISEWDLSPAHTDYQLRGGAADGLQELRRDLAMYCVNDAFDLCLIGIENQTKQCSDMPLRVLSYDGAAYQQQILDRRSGSLDRYYPVVTLVLYYGQHPWTAPTHIHEMFSIEPRSTYSEFISDYKINLFDVGRAGQLDITRMKSDFRVIAAVLCKAYQNRDMVLLGRNSSLRHPEEVGCVLAALSENEKVVKAVLSMGKEIKAVSDVYEPWRRYFKQEGLEEGRQQERERTISSFMERNGCTREHAIAIIYGESPDDSEIGLGGLNLTWHPQGSPPADT